MDTVIEAFQRLPPYVQLAIAGLGVFSVVNKLWSSLQLLLSFVLPGTNLRKYGKPGTWAVVTGASDGLGKEYALQLASKGFNLVLVSRTESKLATLAAEIKHRFAAKNVDVKILAMDFTRDDEADYARLEEIVRPLDVGVLINNVGQSHSIPVPFLETPKNELQNIITVNCLGTLKVTQIVAPILKQRKSGLILTMGSFGGWTPTPLLATYSGSKAFLQHWSAALASELASDNVDVYLVLSHLVTTAMSKIRRPNLLVPTPRPFVKATLGKIGLGGFQTAPSTYTPWYTHAIMLWVIESTVGFFGRVTIWQNKNMHVDIRKRALKKQARLSKTQ